MTEPPQASLTDMSVTDLVAVPEASAYTPVVTVRRGTGDRTGDRGQGPEDTLGETPGAGGAHAPARGASVIRLLSFTQRKGVVSDSRLVRDARDLYLNAADDMRALWGRVLDEDWMHGSDNDFLRWGGRAVAAIYMTPVLLIAHLINTVVALALDVTASLMFRFSTAIAAGAILIAVWLTWPFGGDEPTAPPTAGTEVVQQDSAPGVQTAVVEPAQDGPQ